MTIVNTGVDFLLVLMDRFGKLSMFLGLLLHRSIACRHCEGILSLCIWMELYYNLRFHGGEKLLVAEDDLVHNRRRG